MRWPCPLAAYCMLRAACRHVDLTLADPECGSRDSQPMQSTKGQETLLRPSAARKIQIEPSAPRAETGKALASAAHSRPLNRMVTPADTSVDTFHYR